jgi:hypothetical protein
MRADALVTAIYLINLAAPVVAYASIRRARAREHDRHRAAQVALLVACWIAVLALEIRIRIAGGSGVFLALAPAALAHAARGLFGVHVTVAVATYLVWTSLAISSWRRYRASLPGSFSRLHRRLGRWVFRGLCFNALSATGMLLLAFVL